MTRWLLTCLLLTGCASGFQSVTAPEEYWSRFALTGKQTPQDRQWDAGQCYGVADRAVPTPPDVRARARRNSAFLVTGLVGGPIIGGVVAAAGSVRPGEDPVDQQLAAWQRDWREAFDGCMTGRGYRKPN